LKLTNIDTILESLYIIMPRCDATCVLQCHFSPEIW